MAKQRQVKPRNVALAASQRRLATGNRCMAAERMLTLYCGETEQMIYRGKCEDRERVVKGVRAFIHEYEGAHSEDPNLALGDIRLEQLGGARMHHIIWAQARGWGRVAVAHLEFTRMHGHGYGFKFWRYGNTVGDGTPGSQSDNRAVPDFFRDPGIRLEREFGPNLTKLDVKTPTLPRKIGVRRKWETVYELLKRPLKNGDTLTAMSSQLRENSAKLPFSPETLRKIIAAGDAGLLGRDPSIA